MTTSAPAEKIAELEAELDHWHEKVSGLISDKEAAEAALASQAAENKRLRQRPVVGQLGGMGGWWVLQLDDEGIYQALAASPYRAKEAAYIALAATGAEDKAHG